MSARQAEFERVAMPEIASLLRVARRLTRDRTTADDLVQETMLRAWRGFHQFEPGTNVRAWLFRILFHTFYSEERKRRNHPPTVPLPASADEMLCAGSVETLEVAGALAALSSEHRDVLLLAAVEGFTCREIAGILSLPMGTVMSRLSRARQALRERLTAGASCGRSETV
jgi:RNA polymerase sigma-70 factor (ECF subfamily)